MMTGPRIEKKSSEPTDVRLILLEQYSDSQNALCSLVHVGYLSINHKFQLKNLVFKRTVEQEHLFLS
jgi:hypothetical protein